VSAKCREWPHTKVSAGRSLRARELRTESRCRDDGDPPTCCR